NVAAASVELPSDIAAELAELAEPADRYWATRSARSWR
ncbi:MAG: hypothetical protein QOI68_2819, partial [Pseudonocardiales bacterium]|nr:hypothetical protein [Pseudonocardiales bacterium]